MNIKKRILSMDKYLVDEGFVEDDYVESYKDLLLTVCTNQDIYQPCIYVSESNIWLSIIDLSLGEGGQFMDIKKDNIISFGLYNGSNIFEVPNEDNKSFYR